MATTPLLTVFVSYARADRPRVARLAAALTAAGHKLWWDDHLEGGAAFAKTIEDELAAADAVVVVWSAASAASDWVRDEAAVGRDRGVLVPVSLDGTPPPLGFRQYHAIDLSGWDGRDDAPLAALSRAIAGAGGRPPAARPAPPPPVAPKAARRRPRGPVQYVIAGVIVVGALGGTHKVRHDVESLLGIAPSPADAPAAAPAAAATSIAVLPFANLSGEARDDYLSAGLAEELRSTLASFSQLQVAARTSSTAFKGKDVDARAIGEKLGVAYVVEGSVRRNGDEVRVDAQLIEAATGFQRWSQRYDHPAGDTFRVQDEISGDVADALKIRLLLPPTVRGRGGTENAAALDAYLRGRAAYDRSGEETTWREALADFDAAIAADPGFAAAYAARARTLIVIGNQYSDGKGLHALLDQAVVAARRAVALAPDLPDSQSTLGFVLYNRLDFAGADAAYDRAYRASAGDADQLVRYAGFKYRMGDIAAATAALGRAATLDPLSPRVPRGLAHTLFAARRYPEAIAAVDRALALNPKMGGAHALRGDARVLSGDAAGAKSDYAAESQTMLRLTGLAIAEHKLGDVAAAKAALADLIAKGGDNTLYQQAQVLAQWGDTDGAIAALTRARAAGDTGLVQLKSDPLLDPLRGDARFAALLAALHFV